MSIRIQPETDLNLTSLAEAVALENGLPVERAKQIVQSSLDIIGRTVVAGYRVKLGNFGTFERGTHNVSSSSLPGREFASGPVRTVRFRSSGRLRAAMKAGMPPRTLRRNPKSR